jgi:hypothetical protein
MTENRSNSRITFGLIDLLVLLLVSSALLLFFSWLAGKLPLDKLPDPVAKAFGWASALLAGSGAAAAAFRARLSHASPWFYLLGIPVAIALMLVGVIATNKLFPGPVVAAAHSPSEFWVHFRFQVQPGGGRSPEVLFSQLEPLPVVQGSGQTALAIDPGTQLYDTRITLPDPGKQFIAAIGRNNDQEARRGAYIGVTNMRFVRKKDNPPDDLHAYAKLECAEGQNCSINDHDPQPGWVEKIVLSRPLGFLSTAVYAQTEPANAGPLPWLVPTLDTLQKQSGQSQIGFTKFLIQSPGGPQWQLFDFFTYAIRANSVPVAINGWRPEYLRVPIDGSKGLELQFGLENLDFAGAEGGCDTIDVALTLHRRGGRDDQTKTVKLFRNYIALRNAEPANITAPDGMSFTWSGQFVQAQDKFEVFVGSTPDVNIAARMKAELDSGRLRYQETEIRGQIRPPLTTASYGVAIGLQQPSGQIRFTLSQPEAQNMMKWWSQILEGDKEIRRLFQVSPFVYKVKPNGENSNPKVCSAAGVRA